MHIYVYYIQVYDARLGVINHSINYITAYLKIYLSPILFDDSNAPYPMGFDYVLNKTLENELRGSFRFRLFKGSLYIQVLKCQ